MTSDQMTFFLGLGAQKAGTTWLSRYLYTSGEVAMNVVKEYHVWDALHIPGQEQARVRESERDLNTINKLRFVLQQSPDNYFSYFIYMMKEQGKAKTFDITPNYAGLGRAALKSIAAGFRQRNVATKAIFLMRDPVERCWSAARQKAVIREKNFAIADEDVLAHASLPGAIMRTRYDLTVSEIEAAFDPTMAYIAVYEEMFEPENIRKLSEFCGIAAKPDFATTKVNATPPVQTLNDDTCQIVARRFRGVYDFAAARYPQVTQLWRGFKYL